ncbi:hypothetical protein C8034_v010296 [Colletotrichum sidae]|uniref:Uncharacterized protein n=1 Tax=Colletotrichum sidae TaxID=1347389 RepID=A0A4R8TKX4_9PEZI|nr:hypothetical protein C8034_v010296 [Colletotrichum sidae]
MHAKAFGPHDLPLAEVPTLGPSTSAREKDHNRPVLVHVRLPNLHRPRCWHTLTTHHRAQSISARPTSVESSTHAIHSTTIVDTTIDSLPRPLEPIVHYRAAFFSATTSGFPSAAVDQLGHFRHHPLVTEEHTDSSLGTATFLSVFHESAVIHSPQILQRNFIDYPS